MKAYLCYGKYFIVNEGENLPQGLNVDMCQEVPISSVPIKELTVGDFTKIMNNILWTNKLLY